MDSWQLVAFVVIAGFVGGYLLESRLSGRRAMGAWLLWLPVPFVILFIVLLVQLDPSLPPETRNYDFAFGFVLVSLLMVIPWLTANLLGVIWGRRRNSVRMKPVALPGRASIVPVDLDLPDWSKADNPPLGFQEIGTLMRDMAARAGIDPATLPSLGVRSPGDCEFIFRDKFDYVYMGIANGKTVFEEPSVIVDQLLYEVFVRRAKALAEAAIAAADFDRTGLAEERARRQQEILARIDPRWARQFAIYGKQRR